MAGATNATLPLRTGMIGLSASAVTSWAAGAHLPALLHPHGQKNYKITALCNSSVDAAKAAIEAFKLPEDTKAYGSPRDLANDPDIDVVICNTRVDKHYETIVDSVKAGKMVYVEWPVTSSVRQTEELLALAEESGSRVAVGLQGRWAPPVVKLRELIGKEDVGRVLSCEVRAFGGTLNRAGMPVGLKYFGEKAVGGNPITIGFGHMVDFVQSVVGEFVEGTTYAKTQIQFPENRAFDPKTKETVEVFKSDVPDLIMVTGALPQSNSIVEGATLSVRFRRGQPFKGEPALTWSINCEKAEIRLVSPSGVSLQADAYAEPLTIHVHHFGNDSVDEIPWSWSSEQEDVPVRARSVMNALYALAEQRNQNCTSLESATRRARQIDAWVEKGRW